MELKPQEAARKLMENAKAISDMTDHLIEARTDTAMAEAVYLDAKAESLKKNHELSATAAQNKLVLETVSEKKKLIQAEAKMKNFQDLLNVLETSNNNYKVAIKLMEMEARNLNLQ